MESLTVQNWISVFLFLWHFILDLCFECHDYNKYSLFLVISLCSTLFHCKGSSVSVCSRFNKWRKLVSWWRIAVISIKSFFSRQDKRRSIINSRYAWVGTPGGRYHIRGSLQRDIERDGFFISLFLTKNHEVLWSINQLLPLEHNLQYLALQWSTFEMWYVFFLVIFLSLSIA